MVRVVRRYAVLPNGTRVVVSEERVGEDRAKAPSAEPASGGLGACAALGSGGKGGSGSELPPKVAFLLLSSNARDLMERLWREWLRGVPRSLYALHVHVSGRCRHAGAYCWLPRSSFLYGAQLRQADGKLLRVRTKWGSARIVAAEKKLMEHALRDPAVARVVLLSETSAPLWDFATTRAALLAQPSMLAARKDYTAELAPGSNKKLTWADGLRWARAPAAFRRAVPAAHWGKSSQWVSLTSADACAAVDDRRVFGAFEAFCGGLRGFRHSLRCTLPPDEHYFPVLMRALGRGETTVCSGTHHVEWSARDGGHAAAMGRLSAARLQELRNATACGGGGGGPSGPQERPPMCKLFVRKVAKKDEGGYLALAPVWNAPPPLMAPGARFPPLCSGETDRVDDNAAEEEGERPTLLPTDDTAETEYADHVHDYAIEEGEE